MANKKFTDLLPANATPNLVGSDILAVTVDPATTPASNKTTITNLMTLAPVQSVNTQTGTVVLDADDVDDTSTAHKFVTSSDITNLGNLSGTNTGDQDLSSYQLQPAEGAFVDGDKTKLDGIEAGADVTDATNVQAAGALMDNEVTNLAQVKAFNSADYATSTQGNTADSATQPGDNISTLTNDSGFITGLTAGELGDFDFDDNAILGFKASLPTEITASTYTVQDSDNGQVLRVNNSSGCTITIPSGLLSTDSTGFNCSFIQVGTGQITFANDGTSVINNRQSHTKTNAQWAAASTVSVANNVFVLAGDTAS
ncbi:hypothetical protein OAN13_08320 [Opitutales bacterium]|nr:hypothetical protein [Opitutales bacterium]